MNEAITYNFCPECGKRVSRDADWCDVCGTALRAKNRRFRVYSYNEVEAKANGAFAKHSEIFVFSIVATLLMVTIMLVALFTLPEGIGIAISAISGIALIVATITYSVMRKPFLMGAQNAYVWDDIEKTLYSICFMGNQMSGWDAESRMIAAALNTMSVTEQERRAQQDAECIRYVEEYINAGKPTQKFWTLESPEEIVIELRDARVVKDSRRSVTVQYTNFKGKAKKMTIIKAFPGIEECYV